MQDVKLKETSLAVNKVIEGVQALCTDLSDGEFLQTVDDNNPSASLSGRLLNDWASSLDNEKQKVINLEMVLAVVGTIKAGKSTTINAIVGCEILPNRNLPMTTLPTLIRHMPGKTEPLLIFANHGPVDELVSVVRQTLNDHLNWEDKHSPNRSVKMLAQCIRHNDFTPFMDHYHGQGDIFEFLNQLNDLFRLAVCLGISPPYEKYENINDLPVIEVEFQHLQGIQTGNVGRFSILDTPGPNEFGQSESLKAVFCNQLKRASAVALVLDYTQLGSESEHEVRLQVNQISHQLSDRLYVLVNKFDQRDRRSMDATQTIDYVQNNILGSMVDKQRVFPLSARMALLAHRAMQELDEKGQLSEKDDWAVDFCEEAFGRRWRNYLDNPEEIHEAAVESWKESGFVAPVDQVIKATCVSAASSSLQSALDRIRSYTQIVSDCITSRVGALDTDADQLMRIISQIENDIESIRTIRVSVMNMLDEQISHIGELIQTLYRDHVNNLLQTMTHLFYEGKRQEQVKKEQNLQREAAIKQAQCGKFARLAIELRRKLAPQRKKIRVDVLQFDPENPVIEFSNILDANGHLNRITMALNRCYQLFKTQLESSINEGIGRFCDQIGQDVGDSLNQSLAQIHQRLGTDGFSMQFQLPKLETRQIEVDFTRLLHKRIERKERKETVNRRKKGMWGGVCKLFGTNDFGWQSCSVNRGYYTLDMQQIGHEVMSSLKTMEKSALSMRDLYIKEQMQPQLNQSISELELYLQRIYGQLQKGLSDQRQTCDEQEKIRQEFDEFSGRCELILASIRQLQSVLGAVC
ncbi:Clamp-binding protein CrfC [invertebrate metagenome]|uniref:Clamp-binding protein CrfC n=1 Tax=invertebrate metagenome TaxID=1711999 RepID=A0A2H9TAG6_9ZZZZ